MQENSKNFGWSFPIRINEMTGKIETTDFESDIRQSILILLNTLKGERLMHKTYGSDLNKFMFEPISYNLVKNIKDEVTKSIKRWEKRVENVSADVFHSKETETLLIIHIRYTVAKTGEKSELNYVFNLLEAE